MDEESLSQPPVRGKSLYIFTALALVVIIVVIGAGAYFYQKQFSGPVTSALPYMPTQLVQAQRAGDFAAVLKESDAIKNDPSAQLEEKALATYNAAGAGFRLTADFTYRLKDIQELKKIVVDPQVSRFTRVSALNVISASYCNSGRDPEAFKEIYKDEPYHTLLVPGDPDLSARHVAEWSYSIMPTSFSAIRIARWYSEQAIINPDQSASTTLDYAKTAEKYLTTADSASEQEAKEDPTYYDSSRYTLYRYWKALVVGRLAKQLGEPYLSRYRAEYDSFIKFTLSQNNVIAKEYLNYGRLYFSMRLRGDGDLIGAKAQLDILSQDLNSMSNPNTSAFVRYLRDEHLYRSDAYIWREVEKQMKLSPDFQVAVGRLLDTAPQQ